jgi:hypothetical protein
MECGGAAAQEEINKSDGLALVQCIIPYVA